MKYAAVICLALPMVAFAVLGLVALHYGHPWYAVFCAGMTIGIAPKVNMKF